jgi:hypothetical protein
MLRTILIAHRYLGVAVGLVMTLWCLSGFVMMYQGYPRLTESERQQGLAPLDLSGCCDLSALTFDPAAEAPDVRLEMLLGHPVLRILPGPFIAPPPGPQLFDLKTGRALGVLDAAQAREVAAEYGRRHGLAGAPRAVEPIDIDQWTVQTARRNRPVYRVDFDDPAGTEIYVSGRSGEVIQDTDRRERVLGWLGAVPHWLYVTRLRQHGALWSEVVVWTSLVGTVLTLTGLYVGVARFVSTRCGAWRSPFRGWWYWHHISGLVFGILTLTWVASGLLTMNPWGLLAGTGALDEIATVRGAATWSEVLEFLRAVPRAHVPEHDVRQLATQPLGGRLYVAATDGNGTTVRLDAAAARAPLGVAEIENALTALGTPIRETTLMQTWDDFYYRHENDLELPVFRVILDDPARTRIYLDYRSAAPLRGIDATMRTSRWVRYGLHDFDFGAIRVRPLWDICVGVLLAGVTAVCVTGTWLALKRLRLDLRRIRAAAARR